MTLEAFDEVARLVGKAIIRDGLPAARCGRDNGLRVLGGDSQADFIGVVAAIGYKAVEPSGGSRNQSAGHGYVVDVAGRKHDKAWTAQSVRQSVEFARPPTAGDADGLGEGPLLHRRPNGAP